MLCTKKMQPNKETITDLAKKTLLPMDHVRMWLEHLDQVQKNTAEGAKQAAVLLLDIKEDNLLISL